jgi:hypothetical protein
MAVKEHINMFAVQGIYAEGKITINEPVPVNKNYDVVITFLKPAEPVVKSSNRKRKIDALNRITGVLSSNSMTLEEVKAERLKNQ